MCQSNVFATKNGQEELLMEEVAAVAIDGDTITMRSLFGEPLSVVARIVEIDLLKNRIVLEKTGT
jgi:predicted RNA-binding protein